MKQRIFSLIIVAMALLTSVGARAEFRWGPQAGVNFNTLKFKHSGILTPERQVGGSAGVAGEMMFPGIGFGLDLGLRYEMAGAKLNFGDFKMWQSQGLGNETVWVHNVQIPFHLKFKYTRFQGFEDYLAPFVFGGPTFNLQVGHSKCKALDFSGGDLGITCGGGLEIMKRWQISGSYTWGMTYVYKAKVLTDYSCRTRTWDIRVAYFF